MAEVPEVAAAKAKLKTLVGPAVECLGELLESEHSGIRLGASKEILDRGGVPAKHETSVQIEVGLDDEIEALLGQVKKQITQRNKAADPLDNIEDAIVIEDEVAAVDLPIGEQAAQYIGVPLDDQVADAEVENDTVAWWQSAPPVGAETE